MRTQRLGLIGTLLATGAILFSGCGSAKTVGIKTQPGQVKTPEQIAQTYEAEKKRLLEQTNTDSNTYSTEVEKGLDKYKKRTQEIKGNVRKAAQNLREYQKQVETFLKSQDPNYSSGNKTPGSN